MTYSEHFENLLKSQLERIKRMENDEGPVDFSSKDRIVIGMVPGDGIGPIISTETRKVLDVLLKDEISSGRITFRNIDGLTIENRVACMKAIPDDVLSDIKKCDVLLKGPTTTPDKKMGYPDIESANVALRRELELFSNVRPVKVPEEDIDWIFFRENTEGEYALGSLGIDIDDDMSVDFKVTTTLGTRRIARAAFEYAKANGNLPVSIVTKANILKKTDGRFLQVCYEVAKDYPEITVDDYYVDIMSANLITKGIREKFRVFILPNLYGDIITDEAAQIQGGVGTAGSANTGNRYAMFEAVHGSAIRMFEENRVQYASPASLMKAAEMMLRHIGMSTKADILSNALIMALSECNMSGFEGGNTTEEFTNCILKGLK